MYYPAAMSCPICLLPPGNDHRRCYFLGLQEGLWKTDKEWSDTCTKFAAARARAAPTEPEPVATAAPTPAPRKCGVCKQPGHTKKTCASQTAAAAAAAAAAPVAWRKLDGTRYTFPPGRYYLGDICYPLKGEAEKLYDDVWGKQFGYSDGVYTNGTHTFAVFGTAYGDGGYKGSDGVEYSVDAGVIGFVPTVLFDEELFKRNYRKPPRNIHDYKYPVTFECDDGTFMVHGQDRHITIHTAGDGEEEDEW